VPEDREGVKVDRALRRSMLMNAGASG
jgi:hypothetical protein